jgi:2-hydroxy fatty acid dioxygenase
MVCLPAFCSHVPSLLTGHEASNSPTLIPLPGWLTPHYLPLNAGTLAAMTWGGLYVLLEPVAGTILGAICLGAAAAGNYALEHYDSASVTTWAFAVFIVSWIAQFIGHGKFEGRAPALLDNLIQAIFLAPLFVWLEILFWFGYRQELQKRVELKVQKELKKFREEQAAAGAKNGKAQ